MPLASHVEQKAFLNHGLANINEAVLIPQSIDTLDCLYSKLEKECLTGILDGSDMSTQMSTFIALNMNCFYRFD